MRAMVAVLVAIAALTAFAQEAASGPSTAAPHPREKTLTKRVWGVDVVGVHRLAAGTMLEFRYKVLDEQKAAPLFVRKTSPVLQHEATGAKLAVARTAKTGPLRSSEPPEAGRVYWMFFKNPGGFVKAGDRVSVSIGEFRVDGLVVK